MIRSRRQSALLALAVVALAFGCAGPPFAAPIEGVPVCPDFTAGNTKMEGGLRFPVRLRVLDGKTVRFRTVIAGKRRAEDPDPSSYIASDNARYTVEWAQCTNQRAPRPLSELAQSAKAREKTHGGEEGTAYDCGEATVYKSDGVLETRKGDKASHVIKFVPPPDPTCWQGDAVTKGPPAAPSTAPAVPAPSVTASADAGPPAAGAGDAGPAK